MNLCLKRADIEMVSQHCVAFNYSENRSEDFKTNLERLEEIQKAGINLINKKSDFPEISDDDIDSLFR